ERANEHIKNIEVEFSEYLETHKCGIGQYYDERTGEIVLTFKNVPSTPSRFGIIAGEAIHQLRSCLDHIMYQLFLLNGATPDKKTQFPIFKTTEGFKARAEAMIKGVSLTAKARIEALQPYHRTSPEAD